MRKDGHGFSRRDFMKALLVTGTVLGPISPLSAFAQSPNEPQMDTLLKEPSEEFIFGRVCYRGGDWNTDMLNEGLKGGSEINLLTRVLAETSIKTLARETVIRLSSPLLLTVPFLYMTGHGTILAGESEVENMRHAIESGAFLFGDSCHGRGEGFNENFPSFLQRVFPGKNLDILKMDHPMYHCFYDINEILGGDKLVYTHMSGMEIDGRLAVVYTVNDLGCAWEGHPCRPGGEAQRDHAFRVGINMIVYAMTH